MAAFLERAAALSLDVTVRIDRTLAAVHAHLDAGATDTAARLLTTVERLALDEPRHARVDVLRGRIAFARHNDADGPTFMVRAAQRWAALDPIRSRETFLDALEMGLVVGRASGVMDTVLTAARSTAPAAPEPDLLDALIRLATDGHRAAVPLLRTLLHDPGEPLWIRRPALASTLASEMWDPHTHATIVEWLMKTGRESGSPFVLRLGLAQTASAAALTGDLGSALVAIAEEEAIADAIGGSPALYPRLYLAAMRGRRREALADFEAATAIATQTDRTQASATASGLGIAAYARGLVTGVEDHYREAIDHLEESPLTPYRARAHLLYGEWLRRLFLSPRMVDAHLRNIFRKLGINSRRQLRNHPELT